MTKVKELLVELKERHIKLFLKEGDIKIVSYQNKIASEQIQKIKACKDELILYLKSIDKSSTAAPIPTTAKAANHPLSNAQQRVWIMSQIIEGSTAYNLPTQIELIGNYDFDCFKRAIMGVIERHEILRTIFIENENEEPRQIVMEPGVLDFDINFKDFTNTKDPYRTSELEILSDSYKPFNLTEGPLLRASLFQLSKDKYVFYYNMHHIISDGWSMEVLARDVMTYYDAYISNKTPNIKKLRIQYKDYTAWQLNLLNDVIYKDHSTYWNGVLNGNIPSINLPAEKRRPQTKTFFGKSLRTHIPTEITTNLKVFTKEQGGSIFMGLLTVSKVLLHRYTGEKDIVVGNPIAGRDHADLENQIGVYINSLALRNQIEPQLSFVEVYNQIKETTLNALEHQMYPFDRILEELNGKREANRSPLFDVLINYLGISESYMDDDKQEEIQILEDKMVLFDLELDFKEIDGGIDLEIRYNSDVYEHGTIAGFMLHYKKLLETLLMNPQTVIGESKYLLEKEKNTLLHAFNDSAVDYSLDGTMLDVFVKQVQRIPNTIALEFEGNTMTYKELNDASDHFARYLLQEGVKDEALISICMEKRMEMIVGILGIWKSGAAYVPIDPNYPKDRIDYILEDTDSTIILSTSEYREVMESYTDINVIYLDEPLTTLDTDVELERLPEIKAHNLAYVIYTSGSTGKPKGVTVAHRSLLYFLFSMRDHLELDESIRFLSLTTFTFDISLLEFFGPLILGGRLVLAGDTTSKDPEQVVNIITTSKPNCIQATPSRWQMLFNFGWRADEAIILLSGGEAIHNELKEWLVEQSESTWNLYGPTETTIWSCISKLESGKKITIGRPIANTQIYVLDEYMNLMPQGMVGQLCIGGYGLSNGYLNRSELTEQKFIPNPFKENEKLYLTGDLARWLPDGNMEFLGRRDQQIKINGYRIELGEIESSLHKIEWIKQSVVIALENDNGVKQLVAYLVCDGVLNEQEIQDILLAQLPVYMVPRVYVALEEIPLTQNGKINRKVLPTPVIKQEYVAPQNEIQEKLVKIWEDVLQIEKVGIKDSFFQVGGNSLRAIRVLNNINKEFGLKYDLRGIYVENTIELIAERIDIDSRFKEAEELNESEFSEIKI